MGSVGPAVVGQDIFYCTQYCFSSVKIIADIMSRVMRTAGLLPLLILEHETPYQTVTQVQPTSRYIPVPDLASHNAHATTAELDSTNVQVAH